MHKVQRCTTSNSFLFLQLPCSYFSCTKFSLIFSLKSLPPRSSLALQAWDRQFFAFYVYLLYLLFWWPLHVQVLSIFTANVRNCDLYFIHLFLPPQRFQIVSTPDLPSASNNHVLILFLCPVTMQIPAVSWYFFLSQLGPTINMCLQL